MVQIDPTVFFANAPNVAQGFGLSTLSLFETHHCCNLNYFETVKKGLMVARVEFEEWLVTRHLGTPNESEPGAATH
jgi:hypothetical protein